MWVVNGESLTMTEKDWGMSLPITITGAVFAPNDEVKFTLKAAPNGAVIFEKVFTNIVNNTVDLRLTEEESNLLKVGGYTYILDWYQDGAFFCNIIPRAPLRVVDKA